ncbi:MAG: tRNA lysidine(34) synthetase TilS [Nitrospirae bacterium]|nr:tRNA lysidine(34) synthetase TilS [Nitrospirota bacterium]MDA1302983.1 tRNA lysidine(34) synthetase TilS [Nitrospirota bacterium]
MVRFEQQVLARVRQGKLLNQQDRVLVAVSGGPDSVALLHLFCAWKTALNLSLLVVHVNHGLRGEESDDDASFVHTLCGQLDVPCLIQRLQVKQAHQERKGESIQSVARALRYETFTQIAQDHGLTKVALGHTRDDQAETVLMWMLRGAGSVGLSGMAAFRAPYFIRPLLDVSRADIETYLLGNQWNYRIDSSNASPKYRRNRIRHELLPVLKQFNPNIVRVLSRQSAILREESAYLNQVASKALASVMLRTDVDEVVVHQKKISGLSLAIQRRVVLLIYRQVSQADSHPRFDFVESVLDLMNRGRSGGSLELHGFRVYRDYEEIHLSAVSKKIPFQPLSCAPIQLTIPGTILWEWTGQTIEACRVEHLPQAWKAERSCAYFDTDKFTQDLVVRQWESGDFFYPFGMNGQKKKIQDFFSDIKLSQARRSNVPLVVAPEGIIWVGGLRTDHRFRVSSETQRIIALKLGSGFDAQPLT